MTYGSCSSNTSTFNPAQLDTDQWVESFKALGVKEAVLVAKHGCGFTLWPSRAKVPGGGEYAYSVAHTAWREGKGDVARMFIDSCNKAGIRTGFYYSLSSNSYGAKAGWTPDELVEVEKQQLVELWSADGYGNQGNGGHSEIWFDGGFEGVIQPFVASSLGSLQPQAVAFNGCVQKGAGNK